MLAAWVIAAIFVPLVLNLILKYYFGTGGLNILGVALFIVSAPLAATSTAVLYYDGWAPFVASFTGACGQ